MNKLVSWGIHAPLWQLYLAMAAIVFLIMLIVFLNVDNMYFPNTASTTNKETRYEDITPRQ